MSNKKIPALNAIPAITDDTIGYAVQGPSDFKFTYSQLKAYIAAGNGGSVRPSPTPYGQIYYRDVWQDASELILNQSPYITATVDANGKLVFTAVEENSSFSFKALLPSYGYSQLPNWKATFNFTVTAMLDTAILAVGKFCTNNFASGYNDSVISATRFILKGANAGKTSVNMGVANTHDTPDYYAASSTLITPQVGDLLTLTHEYDINNTVYTNKGTVTVTRAGAVIGTTDVSKFISLANGIARDTSGLFTLFASGGTFRLEDYKLESTTAKYADVMFVGDSKTQGENSDITDQDIFVGLFAAAYSTKTVINCGAGYDDSVDILRRAHEGVNMKPKYIILNACSNNWRTGLPMNQSWDDYKTLVALYKAAGIEVIHLLQFFEDSVSQENARQAFNQLINNYPGFADDLKIDVPDIVHSDLTDGVHVNASGNLKIATAVITAMATRMAA